MILVTGTMRSGTSMWMQILVAAGLQHIGEQFPEPWGTSLRAANPRGFYESMLVGGVYYATNPHPETGDYLFPQQTRQHVTKVFIPGLVRTDVAFIDRVVATVRPFREYAASLARMKALGDGDRGGWLQESWLPPALRWWVENFALVRDIATRRYAVHVTTYDRLLGDPGQEIGDVIRWLGVGNPAAAILAVDRTLRTQHQQAPTPDDVEERHAAVFDELYRHLQAGRDLTPAFVEALNRTDRELRPRVIAAREQVRASVATRLATSALARRSP